MYSSRIQIYLSALNFANACDRFPTLSLRSCRLAVSLAALAPQDPSHQRRMLNVVMDESVPVSLTSDIRGASKDWTPQLMTVV